MTVLARARAMRYEVGTNLKGHGIGSTWHLLLPSLKIGSAAVIGRMSKADEETLDRLADRRTTVSSEAGDLPGASLDLVVVGGGGARLMTRSTTVQAIAEHLTPMGALYAESRGSGTGALEGWLGPTRTFDVWPAFGPARVFVPAGDSGTVAHLRHMGFLPPRGTSATLRHALNRIADTRMLRGGLRRRGEIGVAPGATLSGPPAYVAAIAREAHVAIDAAPWALVAPGDYASQKVLLLLFDPVDRAPWIVVKLGTQPSHAERLQNEAMALSTLSGLDLPAGMAPRLRFAGEHAGRGVVGQSWSRGRPFMSVADPVSSSSDLASAVTSLTRLANLTTDHRPAGEVGAALRELLASFRSVHHLPEDEIRFLEAQLGVFETVGGSVPVHLQHGDPGIWNLLVDDDGTVSFLDWESTEAQGVPLWDLIHLQFSFGGWVARRHGTRRRLDAALRHFIEPSDLNERFRDQILATAAAVDLAPELIGPLFYAGWMHRALKEATRRTHATLDRGLYLRMLRELIRRRDDPVLRRLLSENR